MRVKYIEDLHVPKLGDWSPDAIGDWLHPTHGPLPDHLGLLEAADHEFVAALWETHNAIFVFLESLDDEIPDERAPMLDIDTVYATKGWIGQTFRWEIRPDGITCGSLVLLPKDEDDTHDDHEWRLIIFRSLLMMCVHACIEGLTPVLQ